MADSQLIETSHIVLTVLNVIILTFLLACAIIIVKDWRKLYIQKRRPIFLQIQMLTLSTFIAVTDPLYLYLVLYGNDETEDIFDVIFDWVLIPIVFFGVTSFIIRIWLLLFDMELSHILKNKSWQSAIDPSIEAKNFFLNSVNQRRFGGDGWYLLYFNIFLTVLEKGLWQLCRSLNYSVAVAFLYTAISAKALIGFLIWRRLKKFEHYDTLGIRKELEVLILIMLAFGLISALAVPLVISLAGRDYRVFCYFASNLFIAAFAYISVIHIKQLQFRNEAGGIAPELVLVSSPSFVLGLESAHSSGTTTRQSTPAAPETPELVDKQSNSSGRSGKKKSLSTRSISFHKVQSPNPGASLSKKDLQLEVTSIDDLSQVYHWWQIVVTPLGYEMFINHLESEFSVECALFLTEYVQIKQVLMQKYDALPTLMLENKNDMSFNLILPDTKIDREDKNSPTIAISRMAFNLNKSDEGDSKAIIAAFKALYKKYISANDSCFTINISANARKTLMYSLDNYHYFRNNSNGHYNVLSLGNAAKAALKNDKSYIDVEFEKNNSSIEWLLTRLITETDAAAREVASLMSSAFSRFKKKLAESVVFAWLSQGNLHPDY